MNCHLKYDPTKCNKTGDSNTHRLISKNTLDLDQKNKTFKLFSLKRITRTHTT